MPYRVRRTDVKEARELLLDVWASSLPARGDLDAKFRWFYCDGPHGRGHAFVLSTDEHAKAIGCAGLGVRAIVHHGRPLRAALFADLAIAAGHRCVPGDHRGGAPAVELLRAVRERLDDTFDVGYGFASTAAVELYRRCGYAQLGELRCYARVLRNRRPPFERASPIARRVGALVDRAAVLYASLRAYRRSGAFALRWLGDFDQRFDRLWRRAHGAFPIACERTAAFLRWRFSRKPGGAHRIATLVERRTGALRAYAVVRRAGDTAELADLFGTDDGALDALLGRTIPALARAGAAEVYFRFLGPARLANLLAVHGFAPRDPARAVMVVTPRGSAPALLDPEAWYLTDLDDEA